MKWAEVKLYDVKTQKGTLWKKEMVGGKNHVIFFKCEEGTFKGAL